MKHILELDNRSAMMITFHSLGSNVKTKLSSSSSEERLSSELLDSSFSDVTEWCDRELWCRRVMYASYHLPTGSIDWTTGAMDWKQRFSPPTMYSFLHKNHQWAFLPVRQLNLTDIRASYIGQITLNIILHNKTSYPSATPLLNLFRWHC